jgi:hypothetical protein
MCTKLSYRLAASDDLPLLRRLRQECGWGAEILEEYWGNGDRPLCVFSLDRDGTLEDVGMGGWILEDPEDLEAASRASGAVELSE